MNLLKYVNQPWIIPLLMQSHGLGWMIPDKLYLKCMFRYNMGYKLDLKHPTTFNEKLQWLKLNDRKAIYPTMVDKYEVKQYVSDIIGESYVIPTLGVWNKFDEICFDELPDQFVLKCTHDSGGIAICKDKNSFDIESARKHIEEALKRNYYWNGREWPYKKLKHRIIAEPYLEDHKTGELRDYKVFNYNGIPEYIQVDIDRFGAGKRNLYTPNWEFIPASNNVKHPFDESISVEKPEKLDEILYLAAKLSKGFIHLRTDFYYVNGAVKFGELTFYHGSGFALFSPPSFDLEQGKKIKLGGGVS